MKRIMNLSLLIAVIWFAGSGIRNAIGALTDPPAQGTNRLAGPVRQPKFLNATMRVMGIEQQ